MEEVTVAGGETIKSEKPAKAVVCKRLSGNASKAERALAHIVKMGVKKKLNEHNVLRAGRGEYVLANQSQRSEFYGETPQQQTARMLAKKSS